MVILGVLIFALVIIFSAATNWKLSIKAILLLVVVEGALRRWFFPDAKDLIYFLKDFILIGSYLGFASRPRTLVDRYPFIKELTILVAIICCFQAFNPGLGSPIIGLLGIRAYLLYIPLIWVVPHLFDSELDLHDFLRNYLFLLIPVCLLGIIQFFSPIDSPLNVYVAGEEQLEIATAGEFVRITGTFSYLQGFKVYLAVCFSLLMVLIPRERIFKWQVIYSLELTLLAVTSFMTGARALLLYEILFVIGYIVCIGLTSSKTLSNFVVRFFLPLAIASVIATVYFQPAIQSFSDRVETSNDSVSERIIDYFTQVFVYAEINADGYGTGATQGGANSLRRLLDLPSGEALPFYEEETGRVMLEIGIVGFIVWYGLRIVLFISLVSVFLKLKHPLYKELALAIFLFQIINLPRQLVTDPTMLVYFWFFSGFIYLLPTLENQAKDRITFDKELD